MSKNLTRKGLAFGAVVALGATLFAGTPASAAEELTLTSTAGTSYKTLLGTTFSLSTLFSGFASAPATGKLKYEVTGATAAQLTATTEHAASASLTNVNGAFDNSQTSGITDKTDPTVATILTTEAITLGNTSALAVGLASSVTATTTIKVFAYLDTVDTNGKWTAGETKSAAVDITFVKPSEVTATTTIDPALVGSELSAYVTLSGDINLAQLTSGNSLTTVKFLENGGTISNDTVAASYSKADKALKATTTSAGVEANKVYTAQAYVNTAKSGSAAISDAGSGSVDIANTFVAGNFPKAALSDDVRAGDGTEAGDYIIRSGVKTVAVSSKHTYTDANGVVEQALPAGVPAKVTVAETADGSIAAGTTITAGGKSLTNATTSTADSITFDATTNATGKVVFDLASSTGKNNDKVNVTVKFLDIDGTWRSATTKMFRWADVTATSFNVVRNNSVGSSPVVGVAKGGSYTLTYKLTDDFGAVVPSATRRALHLEASDSTPVVAFDKTVEFVNGTATLTVTDGAGAVGDYTVTAQLQKRNSADSDWENVSAVASVDTDIYVQDSVTPKYVSVDKSYASGTKGTISYTDFVASALDKRSNPNNADVVGAGVAVTVNGNVLAADGNAAKGVAVVIAGAGLEFVSNSDNVFSIGSITVYTDSSGDYTVDVYSHKAGKQAITVTAGAIVKTVTPEWDVAASDSADSITIDAPSYLAAGSTKTIVVTLKDEYGNAVDTTNGTGETFSIVVTGAGATGTIPADSNTAGEFRFYQMVGTADSGSFVVTVKYDRDGTSTTYAQMTKSATVTIGSAPVAAATAAVSGSKGKFFVSATNAAAKKVVVKVAGKFFGSFTGTAAKKSVALKAPKGSHKVTVFVGGKLVATKTVTVK